MKKFDIRQFDEKDKEITDALISLGMSRNISKTLSYLRNVVEATSTELERSTGLRQPEVSIVMKQLMENDWIKEREEKKPGKGRPYKIYSLKVGFDEIISQIETQQKKAVDEAKANIERLKELEK